VAVGDFSLQGTRHYFGISLSRHFITDDLHGFGNELRPSFKNRGHHPTDVLCCHSTQLSVAEREAEAVAAIWLTKRRKIIQEIFVINAT
jgi:hypothetical protein